MAMIPARKCSHLVHQHRFVPLGAASSTSASTEDAATISKEDLSQMTLPQLLQALNESNIRYPPDATRSKLEDLVMQQIISKADNQSKYDAAKDDDDLTLEKPEEDKEAEIPSKPKNGNARVVDAVVLDDVDEQQQPRKQTQEKEEVRKDKQSYRDERYASSGYARREGRIYGTEGRRQQESEQRRRQEAGPRQRASGRENGRQRQRDLYEQEMQRRNYYRQRQREQQRGRYYGDDRRQRRRAYDLQTDQNGRVIDLDDEFYLSNDEQSTGDYYDNGLQIFAMGFWEAGKTAAELALDAAVSTVNPFGWEGGEEYDDGDWWYDEERDRKVLDANILDYSPQPSSSYAEYDGGYVGRRLRQRRNGYVPSGRSGRRRRRRPRQGQDYRTDPYQQQRRYYQSSGAPREPARADEESMEENYGTNKLQPVQNLAAADSDQGDSSDVSVEKAAGNTRQKRRRRSDVNGPIYGLYNDHDGRGIQSSEDQQDQDYYYKKQWKDRLRTKFDAALGLQQSSSPSSSSSSESYYDSWKVHMKDNVDDGRKEVLRQRMEGMDDESGAAADTDPDQSTKAPRNNRRARMRAKSTKANFNQQYRPLSSSRKSRLDEVPFWREGGTIASLLFDNRDPSSSDVKMGNGRRRPGRRDSLEQLLLSPFGRDHTVTSLFLYISRSILSSFSILCRWAGVRGTIPQPIVVATVFAILLSSRRGTRVMSVGLTLLGLRLVGEFVHGGLHGNEFWDDEYDAEDHHWKDKIVK